MKPRKEVSHGRRSEHADRREAQATEERLNNFLSRAQRAAATKLYRRRLAWYHGPNYRETGHTGMRVEACINALPAPIVRQLRADCFGGFAPDAIRWSLYSVYEILDHALTSFPQLYSGSVSRGTLRINRNGQPFAEVMLESEAEWAAAERTNNPTGRLRDAPKGALRILLVCTFGLGTGVEMRLRTERILSGWRVDAWLETLGVGEAEPSARFADVILVTTDEEAKVATWGPPVIVVENWLDPAEIRRKLAALPEVQSRRTSCLTS